MARRKRVSLDTAKLKEFLDELDRISDEIAELRERLLDAAGVTAGGCADPAID